jgi:hypothetical protein
VVSITLVGHQSSIDGYRVLKSTENRPFPHDPTRQSKIDDPLQSHVRNTTREREERAGKPATVVEEPLGTSRSWLNSIRSTLRERKLSLVTSTCGVTRRENPFRGISTLLPPGRETLKFVGGGKLT